ncbi:Phenylalanyl-tRNA synthetase beta chain [hydrothermal vent metagenome]|uniref:phenylalanine--tRNA ligase n=1 Tax=hydrothermal vent metagenome TaxID=652676 RepID=A0A3B1DF26_9ZZZZ
MIVSWNWLQEYTSLDMSQDDLTHQLTMSGLNLEGVEQVGDDIAIDLEVTSNRPDCLGHLGVAREISVLYHQPLNIPVAEPVTITEKTSAVTSVENQCVDLCPRYIARVVRGVKVAPSPEWLQKRLLSLGINPINNVVDITNYVLMECGQPLHAFDFDQLAGNRIVVRQATENEKIVAIDQKEYSLTTEMCVIADAEKPVAIAGVMGGLETEISDKTTTVLIEVADFAPLTVRNSARCLSLHSDSSFRFERQIDVFQMDYASRRCCQLILELAGGELLDEPIFAGKPIEEERPQPIEIRYAQIPRLLGIPVSEEESHDILLQLGLTKTESNQAGTGKYLPPTWRRDLTREVDLIEEVARIHGYEKIPDDSPVPMGLSKKSRRDRVNERVGELLTSMSFFETITLSFVDDEEYQRFTPHTHIKPLSVEHSSRKRENILRQSLIPSLLECRRENEKKKTFNAQLFEIAKVYLESAPGEDENRVEPTMISCVSGRSFAELKGVITKLASSLNGDVQLTTRPANVPQFASGRGAEIFLNEKHWGWLGEIDRTVTDSLDLQDAVTCAELKFSVLEEIANLTPQYTPLAQFPAIDRDLSFLLDESVTWEELEKTARDAAGTLLESVSFGGQYRGKQIDAGKKSYVITLSYRSLEKTLTHEEVEKPQATVVAACEKKLNAKLRG